MRKGKPIKNETCGHHNKNSSLSSSLKQKVITYKNNAKNNQSIYTEE